MKNIFAYTGPTPTEGYPGYVSVNADSSGRVFLSVRSPGQRGEALGCVEVPAKELAKLAVSLLDPRKVLSGGSS